MRALLIVCLLLGAWVSANAQAPAAPTSMAISPITQLASSSVVISWTDNSSDETRFEIERKIGAGAFVWIADTPANNSGNSQAFLDQTGGTAPSNQVTFRARACNASGCSAYTNEPTAVTLASNAIPAAPTSVTATWTTTGITVNWSHAAIGAWTNGIFENTTFQVFRSTSSTGPFELIGGAQNNGTYKDRQWVFGVTYFYKVRGWHYRGIGPFSSVSSGATTASATTPVAAISANGCTSSCTGLVGEPIRFSASTSTYVSDLPRWTGTAVEYPYSWNFGTGEDSAYNLRETAYAFRTAGVKTVTLTVRNPNGTIDTEVHNITISDITVSAAASHVCTAGESGAVVSAVHRPVTYATLQAAINASVVQDNPLIELATGSDYVSVTGGSLLLATQRTGAGYVTIRPINYASNFTNQKRVTSADIANMGRIAIVANSNFDIIIHMSTHATNPVHHYRLQGIQIKKTSATETQEIEGGVIFAALTSTPGVVTGIPHHVIFQHFYLDGDPVTSKWTYGIRADVNYFSLLDSDIQHIKKTTNENYGIYGNKTEGTHVIDNNKLYGFGMAVFYSGEDTLMGPNHWARHLTLRRNWFTRRAADRTNPALAGHHWKNLIEWKRVEFLEVHGNMLGPCWNGDQDGTPILLTPVNQTGEANYSAVKFVEIKNNVVRDIDGGAFNGASYIDIYSQDNGGYMDIDTTQLIAIVNNLFFDGVGGSKADTSFQPQQARGEPPRYLTIEHNTSLNSADSISIDNGGWIGTTEQKGYLLSVNNIWESGYVKGSESGAFGKQALDQYMRMYNYHGNVVEGGVNGHSSWTGIGTANVQPATVSVIAFTDFTNRILTLSGTSPYRAAGSDPATDGTDRGASIPTLVTALGSTSSAFGLGTTKAETGDWSGAPPPSILTCKWSNAGQPCQ